MEHQDKGQIQHDVQPGGQGQEIHRGPAVPQGPDDAGQQVVEEHRRNAQEDHEDIGVGVRVQVVRGAHGGEDGAAEQGGGHRQHQGDGGGEIGGVGREPPHLGEVLGPHLLGHGDGEAGAHPQAEADHEEVDGAGGAHRAQGLGAQQLAHDHGVHQVIELLEQQAEQGGQGEV